MIGLAIGGCAAIATLLFIIVWQVIHHRRRPRIHSTLVLAESLEPQVVCRPVPCQHPYYRVISEYCDQDVSKDLSPSDKKPENVGRNSRKFDYTEWSRSLSLSGIPRKPNHVSSKSRRSSTSDVGIPLILNTKAKPYLVT